MKKDQLYVSDLGDGRYQNPVLLCDYSDPDAIRVGDTYYMTASTFNYVPGLPILVSKDLINWQLKNYALESIPEPRYAAPQHAQGVWAPAIRWHDGYFYIYYGMPDEGIFMVRAKDALGKWDAPVCVLPGKGLIDPCPFWDDDGLAYVVHGYAKSRIGFKSFLGIFPMTPDGTRAVGPDRILYDGRADHPTIEGPKVHKRNGEYYIFAPAGGVATGWQVVLRGKDIHGPFDVRVVLKQGSSRTNGPHQGAWIDTPQGEDWFMHFQSRGLYGRVTHLQPMCWQADGWPFIGQEDPAPVDPASIDAGEDAKEASLRANAAACGVPVDVYRKPAAPVCERTSEQGSDDFAAEAIALQWQFMGNPPAGCYELMKEPARLRLHATPPQRGDHLWGCAHVLTQKIACAAFAAETTLDFSCLGAGERAGLALIGGQYAYAAVERTKDGARIVYVESDGGDHRETELDARVIDGDRVTLRAVLTPTGTHTASAQLYAGKPGEACEPIGRPWAPSRHMWVGVRLGLFAIGGEGGSADFGAFTVVPMEENA